MNNSFYCVQPNCNGLLLESPLVLLIHPADHMYQCLSCNYRYLRKDDEIVIRPDYNQKRNLHFSDFKIDSIQWSLKKNDK